jgi:hypothetical protein
MTAVGQNVLVEASLASPREQNPSSRINFDLEFGHPRSTIVVGPGRYVACIVSFFASNVSPFFHSRNAAAAILRASVNFAMSSSTGAHPTPDRESARLSYRPLLRFPGESWLHGSSKGRAFNMR